LLNAYLKTLIISEQLLFEFLLLPIPVLVRSLAKFLILLTSSFTFPGLLFAVRRRTTMKSIITTILLSAIISVGCNSASKGLFGKKTPHEQYEDILDKTDLEETPAGREWLAASRKALESPYAISLPYKQEGYFGNDKARALGLTFTAKPGERLIFTLNKKPGAAFVLYADLFKKEGTEANLLHAADTTATGFSVDVDEAGTFVLRLQPELFQSGQYSLSVSIGPSLSFPVSGSKAKTGSFWGASRDGGKRSHEGIDIFAPKHTPAIAAADGIITGVREGGIGGKVVWLRPEGRNVNLYYAHLDLQLVHEGQAVKKGQTVGLVGNTGNAKHTASHLHFGVYTARGPIDPFPFVNPALKAGPDVPSKTVAHYLRLVKTQSLGEGKTPVKANTTLVPLAVTAKGYLSELPDGSLATVPFAAVQVINLPMKNTQVLAEKTGKGGKGRSRM
jgi:peptidoglycan LD-endopeptidase LytH